MTQHSPDPAERLDESELRGLKTALRAMFRSETLVIDCLAHDRRNGGRKSAAGRHAADDIRDL